MTLKVAARKGVTVRLLIWFNEVIATATAQNVVGKTPSKISSFEGKARDSGAAIYSKIWFTQHERNLFAGAKNIQIRFRDIKAVPLANEDPLSKQELTLLAAPTDHQKTVMIDYGKKNAHGFIMGHNSLTEYWDKRASICFRAFTCLC